MSAKNSQNYMNKTKGFAAILMSILVASVLMFIIFSENQASFFARFDALGSESKRISLSLSESCQNVALLKVAQDYEYNLETDEEYIEDEGVRVNVGTNDCFIKSIEPTITPSPECDASADHKCLEIMTTAKYPEVDGSWSTNETKILIQNPTTSTMTSPISIISSREI